jgi:hypothetical protein
VPDRTIPKSPLSTGSLPPPLQATSTNRSIAQTNRIVKDFIMETLLKSISLEIYPDENISEFQKHAQSEH